VSGKLRLAQAQPNRGRRGRKNDFPDAERVVKRLVPKNCSQHLFMHVKIASEDAGPADPYMPILIEVLWRNRKEKKSKLIFTVNEFSCDGKAVHQERIARWV
jgi:hypothetical protein